VLNIYPVCAATELTDNVKAAAEKPVGPSRSINPLSIVKNDNE
jgi:hypothetical protein